MKKTTKYILIGLGVIVVFNVLSNLFESDPEPLPDKFLKVETVKIKGHLGDCFEVVNKEYKVQNDFSKKLIVEIKRTTGESQLLNENIENITGNEDESGKCYIDFVMEFLDEGKNVIATTKSSSLSREQIVSLVKNTRPGETGIIEFYYEGKKDSQSFRLGSICEVKAVTPETLGSEISEAAKEISEIAKEQNIDKSIEDMGKVIETEVKMFDALEKAINTLNELEKKQ